MIELFFDECISSKMVKKLDEFLEFHPQRCGTNVSVLNKNFSPRAKDSYWLGNIDKNSIVVTADWGRGGREKLHHICREENIRCVILSRRLQQKKQFYKLVALLYCWDEVLEICKEPAGVQYVLRQTQKLKPCLELKYSPLQTARAVG